MELRPGAAGAMHFVYQLRGHEITPRRQDSEYSIAATFRLVDQYMPGRFKPREIYFEHERRGAYQIYADYFGCDVFFGQTINAIVFDPAILSTRSPRLSTRLYPIISAHLQSAMTHRTGAARIADQVGLCLTDEILGGRVTIAQVAARLGLSATALARRLAAEGASFREVLGARRMASAERLLLESRAPISEIALRLGYGENASFTRAFRRHGGQTPEQFRVAARRAADSDTAQDRTRPGIRNDR
jgi:AraC-like DNA-binding protein